MSNIARIFTLIVILMGILSSFACEERATPPQEPEKPEEEKAPPLEDGIPFDKLGFGKLVFHRFGPPDNNYSSVYVIDINERQSWGILYGASTAPMVSPDGSKIAFSKLAGDTLFDIHVMNIDGSNIQNISHIEGQDRLPTWMPDSMKMLFWIGEYKTLYRQSPIPNPPDRQLIKDFSTEGSISSPFHVSKDLKLAFVFAPFGPVVRKIYTMNIEGASYRPIIADPPEGFECRSPCWSPDGQKIAYLLVPRSNRNSLEVIVINADGKDARSLAKFEISSSGGWASSYWDNDFSICWSPDGSKLVFNKKDGDYCYHLYLINIDGTELSQVTLAESVTDRSVSWSIK
jgi:Tol biopolymer transport system component